MSEYSKHLLINKAIRIFIYLIITNIKSHFLDLGLLITLNRVMRQVLLPWNGLF
jgi:hypothetical protein